VSKKDQIAEAHKYALRFSIQNRAHRIDRMGTFGPASPVRRIDPKTGEVLCVLPDKKAEKLKAPASPPQW
jgi:hypothetical protein